LEKRNTPIHHIETVWTLEDEQGIEGARRFIDRVFELNAIVLRVFLALIHTWQAEADLNVPPPESVFNAPDEYYRTLANSVFFKKE
jgi:hypothetical protein